MRRTLFILLLGAAVAACSSDDTSDDDGGGMTDTGGETDTGGMTDTGGETDAGGETDTGGEDTGPSCTETEFQTVEATPDPACPGAFITEVRGAVVDEAGSALPGSRAQLCLRTAEGGNLLCLRPEAAGCDGDYQVIMPDANRCVDEITMRVLEPAADRATTYCHIDLTDAEGTIDTIAEPFTLYATTPATTVPDGDGTVVFDNGIEVDVTLDALDPTTAFDFPAIAATEVDPTDSGLCFLEGDTDYERIIGFSPEINVVDGAFPIRIPNTNSHAPGTTFDVYALGGLGTTVDGDELAESVWEVAGTATVSDDGAFIESDAGLHVFNWIGLKAQ